MSAVDESELPTEEQTETIANSAEGQVVAGGGEGALIEDHDEGVLTLAGGMAGKNDIFEAALEHLPRTLLQYDAPIALAGHGEEEWEEAMSQHVVPIIARQKEQLTEKPVVTTTEKVLEAVFPPRQVTIVDNEGIRHRIIQKVNRKQCARDKLAGLQEEFQRRLMDSKARDGAICPVRRAIHNMMFDELLRQVTIDNSERGLLLMRIRDELRMSLDAYVSLYEASVDYGSTKLQEGTVGKPEMLQRIKDLTTERDALKKEVSRLTTKHLSILRCVDERVQTDQKKYAEEKAFWERTKQRLTQHLETVKEMQEAEKRALKEGH